MEESHENYHRQTEGNTLGLVGFILSLLCCCSIIGLPLCLIALRKQPRGLAIAGTVIGLLWMSLFIFGGLRITGQTKEWGYEKTEDFFEVMTDSFALLGAAQQYEKENGHFPTRLEQIEDSLPEENRRDPWGTRYRVVAVRMQAEKGLLVKSAGPDQTWGTPDDPTPMWNAVVPFPNEPTEDQLIKDTEADEALPTEKK